MKFKLWMMEPVAWSLALSFIVHWIPANYFLRQTYELSGNISEISDAPSRLTEILRNDLREKDWWKELQRPPQCSVKEKAHRLECTLSTTGRSRANSISQHLLKDIPSKIGWVPQQSLRDRIEKARGRVAARNQMIQSLTQELGGLELIAIGKKPLYDQAQREKSRLQIELDNHKKQLEMIREALLTRPNDEKRALFESKERDLAAKMISLEKAYESSEKDFFDVSTTFRRIEDIQVLLPQLRADLDLGTAQVSSWTSVLSQAPNAPTIADPDTFQVAALPSETAISGLRSFSHIPWSLILGFLLFAVVRRKVFESMLSEVFSSAEEIERETGLTYLGRTKF